jgi:hypothetical protein
MESRVDGISVRVKESMWGCILNRFDEIVGLRCVKRGAEEYKKTSDFRKICQIVNQYE